MEKNRARITVKFGQAEQKKDSVVKNEPTMMKGPVHIKDKPINSNSNLEQIAAGVEIIPEEEYGVNYKSEYDLSHIESIENGMYSHKREVNKGKMAAIGLSVAGAVAVGLILGFVVMKFLQSGGKDQPYVGSHSVATIKKTATEELSDKPTSSNADTGKAPTIVKTSITLPTSSYFVVQGGVFQEQANAGPILDKIRNHGWPNVLVGEKPYVLLLGIAANRDNALSLASQYKDFDVFIKEMKEPSKTVSVPLKDGEKTSQEEWDGWFEKENEFIKTMGGAIGEGLSAGKIKDDMFQNITNTHRNLLQKGREIVNKLPDGEQEQGNRLLNDYTKIVTAMEQYQKQPSEGGLWQAEQALLDASASKKQLFALFK